MADNTTKLALCGALSHYLDSRDLSDFTIVCQSKSWKTHRLLLSLHSKVLAKSCNGDFKEAKDVSYLVSIISHKNSRIFILALQTSNGI